MSRKKKPKAKDQNKPLHLSAFVLQRSSPEHFGPSLAVFIEESLRIPGGLHASPLISGSRFFAFRFPALRSSFHAPASMPLYAARRRVYNCSDARRR